MDPMRTNPSPAPRGSAWLPLVAAVAAVAVLAAVPAFVSNPYVLHIMILLFLSVIMGSAWNVVGGYAGQYSVGHAAYYGIGAYFTLILMTQYQIMPWWGTWVAMAAALAVALVVGSITFRLRGPYFVLASIAVAEVIRLTVLNWKSVTNGAEGILSGPIPRITIGETTIKFISKVPFYYVGLAMVVATVLANLAVQHSKLGYYFQAIREDQDAAHSLGINLTFHKNVALGISAVFTALAGSYYALYVRFIDPSTVLTIDISVQAVLICIIGGIGTVLGPVVGALVLVALSETLRSNLITDVLISLGAVSPDSKVGAFLKEHLSHAHMLIYGILVVVVILFMPDGIMGWARQALRRRAQAAIAAAAGEKP
jgi:branched-chain amino acid transport system permease protein